MNFRRFRTGLGLVAFLVVATAGAGVAQLGPNPNAPNTAPLPNINRNATSQSTNGPVTPPPPTLAPDALSSGIVPQGLFPAATATPTAAPTPTATPTGGPKRGKKPAPSSSSEPEDKDTPEPPQFTTLDGIWEIELQPVGHKFAVYQHFSINQHGSVISGYWEHDPHKTRTPITGTFDGRVIRIQATLPDSTVTFAGYVESFGDMGHAASHRQGPRHRVHGSASEKGLIIADDAALRALLERSATIAVVGASPNPARPSADVFAALRRSARYDVTPINPAAAEIGGVRAFPSLAAYTAERGAPDLVDVFRKAADAPDVTREAIAAGAKAIWFQLGVVNAEAIALAERAGLDVVVDRCLKIDVARLLP